MKVELFPFQQRHLKNLRMNLSECIGSYERTGSPPGHFFYGSHGGR